MLISRQIRTEVSIIVAILKNENAKNLVALSLLSPKTVAGKNVPKNLRTLKILRQLSLSKQKVLLQTKKIILFFMYLLY